MIVGFIGNDGSGKSTTLREVTRKLSEQGIPFEIIPGFQHLFVERIKSLYQFLFRKDVKALHREYASTKPKRNPLFFLWPFLIYLDCWGLYLVALWKSRNRVVFFDRYPYDYLISFEELGVSSMPVRKLFLWFPKPNALFLFDASPEIAYERKKHDHAADLPHYERQRERYLALAKAKDIPVINTDSDPKEVTAEKVLKELRRSQLTFQLSGQDQTL